MRLESESSSGEVFPEPPPVLQRFRLKNVMRFIGPGAIIASVTIGAGELVWASRSGAIFGYTMLWCFLYAGLFKAVQVYTGMRHLVITGEHPIVAWRSLPGPRLWFPLLIILPMIPIMPIALSTISETVGTFIHQLLGIESSTAPASPARLEFWYNFWGTLMLVACFAVARKSSYKVIEYVSLAVVVALLLCVGISAMASSPQWDKIIAGLFIPSVSGYEPWVLQDPRYAQSFRNWSPWLEVSLYIWAVGGGTQDYVGYVGLLREKRWGLAGVKVAPLAQLRAATEGDGPQAVEQVRRARLWLRVALFDTTISFALVVLVTMLFALLGAQLLHPQHLIPDGADLLTVQETFLTHLHPVLKLLYRGAVFLALGGTLYGAFQVYGVTLAESAAALSPPNAGRNERAWNTAFQYGLLITSLILMWLPAAIAGDIVTRLAFATIIGGATSTAFWLLAMLWTDAHLVPGPLRMGSVLKMLVWIAALIMLMLGARSIIAFFS